MKRLVVVIVLSVGIFVSGQAQAAHSRYVNGVEGLKVGTLPPEGVYWRMYNVFYSADRLKDDKGNSNKAFGADIFAMVNRFIWTTPYKLLGANLTMDIAIPLQYNKVKMQGLFRDHKSGLGDILVEPALLHWHGERWDAAVGVGMYMPTGEFSKNFNANIGKGYWSMLWSAGGTVYFDEEKTWSASILARYENHISEQEKTNVRPGDDFHFEWGVGKSFASGFEVGVAGYCQWQLQQDKGSNAAPGLERAFAIGPEIGYTYAPWGLTTALRVLKEFDNKNTSQGTITSLVFTKAF